MSKQGPLITNAGRNHLLLSKQLCIIIGVVILCAGVLFIRFEQSEVRRSFRNGYHVKEHNDELKKKNEELLQAKTQLEEDEKELADMYEKWIADDSEDLKITKQQIEEIQAKLDAVQKAQGDHANALAEKEEILAGKEDVLADLHLQLKEKNGMIKDMKSRIKRLGGKLPTKMLEMPDDDDWAW
eukprot:m.9936 g.9936  ORF g.9936 m.9936 type:complete len:184 (+) comp6466_c0_seq1:222-773(+)